MSQKPLVDFAISDDSDEDTVPPSPVSLRRSTRILSRESPWVQWPSEKIAATLLDFGIPVSSDLTHDDLILLASNALGSLSASTSDASEAMAPPAQPIQTGRKRMAKSSPPLQHKKQRTSAPTPPPPTIPDSASANAQLSKAILQLTETVKGFETRLGNFESAFGSRAPGPSIPSTSSASVSPSVDPFSSAAPFLLPTAAFSLSTALPAQVFAPALTPLQTAATSLPTAAFSLSTALPAQVFGRPFVPPAAASVSPKLRSNIISGKDINLAALLLPSPAIDRQMVDCGDVAVFLKTSDPRLQRNLNSASARNPTEIRLPSTLQTSLKRESTSEKILSGHPSTPINIVNLSCYLSSHPDSPFVDNLITGLSQGFRVGVLTPLSTSYVAKNLQSALAEPDVVSGVPTSLPSGQQGSDAVPHSATNSLELNRPIDFNKLLNSAKSYIGKGLSQGFRVGVLTPLSTSYVAKNLQSALAEPDVVSGLITKELNKGYLIGPFSSPQFQFSAISKINNSLCPFTSMLNYLKIRPRTSDNSPLFIHSNGFPMTKRWFRIHLSTTLTAAGLSPDIFTSHSFRIGAATTAAERGVPESTIKLLGRWSSSAYETYIRSDYHKVLDAQQSLAT
ncbi:hypothetical protein QQF64_000900 [Cirrhinus molitorella]|uniref:Uncharacterized protein n=1 Tax=Cirrhinus molitorella TaxID=172907 RepID=A0ABR3NZ20_9TELE